MFFIKNKIPTFAIMLKVQDFQENVNNLKLEFISFVLQIIFVLFATIFQTLAFFSHKILLK